jgi:hypothetical protein
VSTDYFVLLMGAVLGIGGGLLLLASVKRDARRHDVNKAMH